MNVVHRPEGYEYQRLGALLKQCRKRIDPECRALGSFLRLPARVGKTVTQEEVAEAVNVSRQWYMMMETGRTAGISVAVLGRVADALMMDRRERATLFRLGRADLNILFEALSAPHAAESLIA